MAGALTKLALVLLFNLGLAQNIPGEPACATSCMSSAINVAGCGLNDVSCQCGPTQAAIAFLAGPCLLGSCNTSDLASLSAAGSALCSSFAAGLVTTLLQAALQTTTTARATTSSSTAITLAPTPNSGGIFGGLLPTPGGGATSTSIPLTGQGLGSNSGPGEASVSLSSGTQAAIALGGVMSATVGAGVVYFVLWSKRRKRAKADASREAPPVDDLVEWIRETGGVVPEKAKWPGAPGKRYTAVDLSKAFRLGPQELDVPAAVYELPGSVLRHEMQGSRVSRFFNRAEKE